MKFTVENLGNIKKAEIEVKPLTIFVGKNGTQKSYMAHVVYGIYTNLNVEDILFILEKLIYDDEKGFIKYVEKILNLNDINELKEIYIKSAELKKIYKYLLKKTLKEVEKFLIKDVRNIFNSKSHFKYLKIKLEEKLNFEDLETSIRIKKEDKFSKGRFNSISFLLKDKIYELLEYILFEKFLIFKDTYYFPSSRTGFVLAFDDIVAGVFRERFGGKSATKLTQPIIDFLSDFAEIKTDSFIDAIILEELEDRTEKNKNPINHLLLFLEQRILNGKIIEKKEEDRYTKFMFKPKNSDVELDLHITSSATIELLPLIEFLKNFSELDNKLLIIEEPEAHLHPKAQIEIARFLALLVNNGVNILITTHSDYIIHEISNCIKLFNLKEKEQKEFLKQEGLENYPDVAISQDKVAVYLFKENKDRIDVERLKVDKFGIEDKNFEDVVDELFERSTNLGERLIEYSED